MKTKMRRLMAIVMAMVMMIAMSTMVSADEITYPYLTLAGDTGYTTTITDDGAVLSVQKLGSDWNKYTFSSSTDATQNVSWTWPLGGGDNFILNKTATAAPGGGYYATALVELADTPTPGPYTLRATYLDNALNPYIDLTLVVCATSGSNATVTVSVNGLNPCDVNTFSAVKSNVVAPYHTTYKYATPVTALNGMIGSTYGVNIQGYHYDSENDYVDYITGYKTENQAVTKTKNDDTWRGWQYRVYTDDDENGTYEVDSNSEIYSASAYKLKDGDYVMWYYGTYYEALSYFPSSF